MDSILVRLRLGQPRILSTHSVWNVKLKQKTVLRQPKQSSELMNLY